MRAVKPILLLLITTTLVVLLDRPLGALPALGRLLDPVNGAMAAAEATDHDFGGEEALRGLKAPVQVWYDHRLVPHIRAQNNHDLYFAQGYIHALFRLWQMDLQTRAAGGRVSEVLGPKAVDYDRAQRRKGMMYAAENSLRAMEADPRTKESLDAYRDGINAYTASLSFRTTPLEYKLMGFAPEKWTNIRTALLLKYMADDLTGYTEDIPLTYLRERLSKEDFDLLYPLKIPGSKHVVPEGTPHPKASMAVPAVPGDEDSLFAHFGPRADVHPRPTPAAKATPASGGYPPSPTSTDANNTMGVGNAGRDEADLSSAGGGGLVSYSAAADLAGGGCTADENLLTSLDKAQSPDDHTAVGSNSWVISPKLTASGAAILCNDPHLALNLPSLWFEVQLQAPGINCYGVSLPGAPGIIIGFNDSVSWGLTNNYRDVKDYYEIHPADVDNYWFDSAKKPFQTRVERIGVKGGEEVLDTVLYTAHGPVQYDAKNPSPDTNGRVLAMCWMAHRPTNELLAVWKWNRATDVATFQDAIHHFECPAQNIAYADRAGNYAQFTQGRYINKWPGQGRFVMNGSTSKTLWGADIPMEENPFALNHPQGYLVAANQSTTDDGYPYWYNGSFSEWRAWAINWMMVEGFLYRGRDSLLYNSLFHTVDPIQLPRTVCRGSGGYIAPSVENMFSLQNSTASIATYNLVVPYRQSLAAVNTGKLLKVSNDNVDFVQSAVYSSSDTEVTRVHIWAGLLYRMLWQNRFGKALLPSTEVTTRLLLTDSASKFYDDAQTVETETLGDLVKASYAAMTDSLERLRESKNVEWYRFKNTHINHLTKIPAFGFGPLKVGGWGTTINANKVNEKGQAYGPSWRMIVEMDRDSIRAYGHYPGGQSGNVGSKWYANMLDDWVEGKYHRLVSFGAGVEPDKRDVMYSLTLKPSS